MARSMRPTNQEIRERSEQRFAQRLQDEPLRTPIPLRASAYPPGAVKVRTRRISVDEDEVDIAHIPTRPQSARQLAEIETILFMTSSLALPVSSLPAVSIEEIDTRPPVLYREANLDLATLDTTPPRSLGNEDADILPVSAFHLLDHARGWLLHPGRLEMLMWVIGTFLLISVTGFFLFILTLSLGGCGKLI